MRAITDFILQDYEQERIIDQPGSPCRPSPGAVSTLIGQLRTLLLPGFFGTDVGCGDRQSYLSKVVAELYWQLESLVAPLLPESKGICREFLRQIPSIRTAMQEDLQAFLAGDPAAAGPEEILVCYPGFYAIMVQRLAHVLYGLQVPLLPRMMTELAHSHTGIDIHPGAVLGKAFFIDHGTGVVIGQTTCIGDGVKIYQGVTLGAISTRGGQFLKNKKRHPTIEDAVTVYAGASILGGDTVIGRGAVIGANAFVTASVEPGAVVIGCRTDPG